MKLIVARGAEPWAPSFVDQKRLESEFPGDRFVVKLYPRSEVNYVLGKRTKPYAFRAVTRGDGVSYVFADATETPRSIAWLIAHELAHREIQLDPQKKKLFGAKAPGDGASDLFHEIDPEELHCDEVATRMFGERLDRAWWRQRTP